MTRSFHHILQEQVEGTLLRLAQPELAAIKIKALGLSNIVIGRKRSHISLAGCSRHANLILRFGENSNDRVTFIVRGSVLGHRSEFLRAGSVDRKSGVSGKSVSLRVDTGGRRSITKKKKKR